MIKRRFLNAVGIVALLQCLASVSTLKTDEEDLVASCVDSTAISTDETPGACQSHSDEVSPQYTAYDDVSWAIKNVTLRHQYHQDRYDRFMKECRKASSYCKGKEALRLYMNQEQPASVYNYTTTGYLKRRTPPMLWKLIHDFYQNNKGQEVVEYEKSINPYHNTWDRHTEIVRLDNVTLGGGPHLQALISRGVRPILEAWTGQKLAPVSVYGIRFYRNESILTPHVDRTPLVTSCIINVDQDVDEDWPLEIYDHTGVARNITMKPGDMVLYESHSVIHGRPFPLKGRFYANAFLHFEPIGSLDSDNISLNKNGAPPYIIPESIWEEEWKLDNPNGWALLNNAMAAVEAGDLRTLELIAHVRPEGLFEKDDNGWAPVHEAVRHGKLEVVKFLIEHGVSPNQSTGLPGGDKSQARIPIELALGLLGEGHEVTKYLWTVTKL